MIIVTLNTPTLVDKNLKNIIVSLDGHHGQIIDNKINLCYYN